MTALASNANDYSAGAIVLVVAMSAAWIVGRLLWGVVAYRRRSRSLSARTERALVDLGRLIDTGEEHRHG